MVFLFGDNGVVPRFGRIGFYAGGEGEVHGDQAVHGTRIRQGRMARAGVGTGRPPHEHHGEGGQHKERLHKWWNREDSPDYLERGIVSFWWM